MGVIGGMLTQHEVCLDVSVDTTLGYRLPASCKLALTFVYHHSQDADIVTDIAAWMLSLAVMS